VLITDAPGHGAELHNQTMPGSDDFVSQPTPSGITTQHAMEKLRSKNIQLMFCPLRPAETAKMETTFRRFYDGARAATPSVIPFAAGPAQGPQPRKMVVAKIVDKTSDIPNYHVIFVLDESGSMAGARWSALQAAVRAFVATRHGSQCMVDRVSVVRFGTTSNISSRVQPLQSVLSELEYVGLSATNFLPALHLTLELVSSSPAGLNICVLFMSDGENQDAVPGEADGSPTSCAQYVASICGEGRRKSPGFSFNCVFFGASPTATLQAMALAAGTRLHVAATDDVLDRTFVAIAKGCQTMSHIMDSFGREISKEVSDNIVLNFL